MIQQKVYNDFIDIEKDRLNKYITRSEKDLNDLTNFLIDLHSNGVSFYKSVNKKITSFFDISKISDVTTKIDQNIKFFYQTSQIFMNSIQVALDKLSLIILTPLKEFKSNYEKGNIQIKKDFDNLSNDFKNIKQKVISYQKRFYSSEEYYNDIKIKADIKKRKNQFKDRDQDSLYKAKSKLINDRQLYKYQIESANNIYQIFDKLYKKNFKNFEISEENKLVFLNNLFNMYSDNMKEISDYINDYFGQINSKFSGWKLEDDKKIIKDEFYCIGRYINTDNGNHINVKSEQRFNKEIFKLYNNTNIKYVNNFYELVDSKKGFFKKDKVIGYVFGLKNKDDIIEYNSYDIQSNEYQKRILQQFYDNLDSQNELSINVINSINELILNDKKFPSYFIKDYYTMHNRKYIRMLNEKNIEHFGNILTTILLSNDLDKNELDNISVNAIYYGERVYYLLPDSENKKLFLCGFLNKIPLFKCIYFWEAAIKYKLILRLQKLTRDIEEKIEILNNSSKKIINLSSMNNNKNNDNDYLTNNFNNRLNINIYEELNSTNDTNITTKTHSQSPTKRKFFRNKNKSNNNDINNLLISIINYEANYEELTPQLKNEYLKKSLEIFNSIITEYIPSFINYNFGLNNSLDLIVKICNDYSISNDMINYYAIYLNNCAYSVKQYSKNSYYDLKNKIEDIRVLYKLRISNKKVIPDNIEKKALTDAEKMIIIKKVSPFLPDPDKINILKLSKKFSNKINKKIYKEILNRKDKQLGIIQNKQMHINVWKILLKYKEIKEKYPYEPNKKIALEKKYDKSGNSDFCIIDLDCQRTLFDKNTNIEAKRRSLNNILKTSVMLNEDGCYCQGMNFVGAFIIKICEDEEESFYFLMGLFKNTDYRSIFMKDLSQLRLYFSVFEEILNLYIPTLYSYFNENRVVANYYLSAWFIALFTSLVNRDQKLDAFLKIFDLFIIDGWKAIFNISMDILRKNEEILLTMKNESLFQYLTSVLGNDFLFNKENYGYLLRNNISKRTVLRISGKLIHNIENQVNQTNKLNEKIK